jgi:hypothetical protein
MLGAMVIGLLVANSHARAPGPMPAASATILEVDVESLPKARPMAPVEECPF